MYFLSLPSLVVKALNEVRSPTRYQNINIPKSHCLVAYSTTWGLLGYSGGTSSKLNPFIDIGLVMIFFTDIYRSHHQRLQIHWSKTWLAYCCRQTEASNDTILKKYYFVLAKDAIVCIKVSWRKKDWSFYLCYVHIISLSCLLFKRPAL